ncbi:hypothetical protein [Bacillus sp. V59.32b]|nr:hypothetical protein [Bacillus sp. V59.32b]
MLEKKYCIHCRTIYVDADICDACGKNEFKAIIIDVQSHPQTGK